MEVTGQILKQNREKAQISLSEVSMTTKINLKVLEAIESGDKSQLPAPSFLRGFVKTYAKYLKLDETMILQSFDEEVGDSRPKHQAPPVADAETEKPEQILHSRTLTSKYFAAGAIIVLIIAILFIRRVVDKYEKETLLPTVKDIHQIAKIDPPAEAQADQPTDAQPNTQSNTQSTALQGTQQEPLQKAAQDSSTDASLVSSPISERELPNAEAPINPSKNESSLLERARLPVAGPKPPPAQVLPVPSNSAPSISAQAPPAVLPPQPAAIQPLKPQPVPPVALTPSPAPAEEAITAQPEKEATAIDADDTRQELIIEALDNTKIQIVLDNGKSSTLNLKASDLHIVKAQSNILLNLTDGGAVSIIHNGQNRGVPGDLGKSLTLNFN